MCIRDRAGSYKQSGAGAPGGFTIGQNVDYALIDQQIKVGDVKAFATSRVLARRHGLMVGGTAGAAIHEGLQTLQTCAANSTVVVLVCDAGEKYLDTVFNDAWLDSHGLRSEIAERHVENMLRAYRDSRSLCAGCQAPRYSAVRR